MDSDHMNQPIQNNLDFGNGRLGFAQQQNFNVTNSGEFQLGFNQRPEHDQSNYDATTSYANSRQSNRTQQSGSLVRSNSASAILNSDENQSIPSNQSDEAPNSNRDDLTESLMNDIRRQSATVTLSSDHPNDNQILPSLDSRNNAEHASSKIEDDQESSITHKLSRKYGLILTGIESLTTAFTETTNYLYNVAYTTEQIEKTVSSNDSRLGNLSSTLYDVNTNCIRNSQKIYCVEERMLNIESGMKTLTDGMLEIKQLLLAGNNVSKRKDESNVEVARNNEPKSLSFNNSLQHQSSPQFNIKPLIRDTFDIRQQSTPRQTNVIEKSNDPMKDLYKASSLLNNIQVINGHETPEEIECRLNRIEAFCRTLTLNDQLILLEGKLKDAAMNAYIKAKQDTKGNFKDLKDCIERLKSNLPTFTYDVSKAASFFTGNTQRPKSLSIMKFGQQCQDAYRKIHRNFNLDEEYAMCSKLFTNGLNHPRIAQQLVTQKFKDFSEMILQASEIEQFLKVEDEKRTPIRSNFQPSKPPQQFSNLNRQRTFNQPTQNSFGNRGTQFYNRQNYSNTSNDYNRNQPLTSNTNSIPISKDKTMRSLTVKTTICDHAQENTSIEKEKYLQFINSNKNMNAKPVVDNVGPLSFIEFELGEKKFHAMIDSGAQVSLVPMKFVCDYMNENDLDPKTIELDHKNVTCSVANGQQMKFLATVVLPLKFESGMKKVKFFVSQNEDKFFIFGSHTMRELEIFLASKKSGKVFDYKADVPRDKDFCVYFSHPNSTCSCNQTDFNQISGCSTQGMSQEDAHMTDLSNATNASDKGNLTEANASNASDSGKTAQSNSTAESKPKQVEIESSLNGDQFNSKIGKLTIGEYYLNFGRDDILFDAAFVDRSDLIRGKIEIGSANPESKQKLNQLLDKFPTVFALDETELDQTNAIVHDIDTGDHKPVKQAAYSIRAQQRTFIQETIQKGLQQGIMRESKSPWASPIVIVPKKNNEQRFCVDYRKLNFLTRKDAYPIPRIDDLLTGLHGKRCFSTLDCFAGYWQVPMDKDSIEKTAFVTPFGLYEFVVMPFGLTNAVATYQRLMNTVLRPLLGTVVFVYLDDILVASENEDEHIKDLEIVFELLKKANLKLKPTKCCFFTKEFPFLGHILTPEGIKKDSKKIEAMIDLPIPKTLTELRRLLGMFSYYRKFVKNFSVIAAPLVKATGGKDEDAKNGSRKIVFNDEMNNALNELKRIMIEEVILALPDFEAAENDFNRRFVIFTDASIEGFGAVLNQPDKDGKMRPVMFVSRKCTPHERKLPACELEAHAIGFACEQFERYIFNLPTLIYTDSRALVGLLQKRCSNQEIEKVFYKLQNRFDLEIKHVKGTQNAAADALSRNFADDNECVAHVRRLTLVHQKVSKPWTSQSEWIEAIKTSSIGYMYNYWVLGTLPDDASLHNKIKLSCGKFCLIDKILYVWPKNSDRWLLVIPDSFQEKLVFDFHNDAIGGHCGKRHLLNRLKNNGYYFPRMTQVVAEMIFNCEKCLRHRTPKRNVQQMSNFSSSKPFEIVHMDTLDIGLSENGFKYALVMIDDFSKYIIAVPLKDKTAESLSKGIIDNLITKFGVPLQFQSDRGTEFLNKTIDAIRLILKIPLSTTFGYSPRSNGPAERANKEILDKLRRNCENNNRWDEFLQLAIFSHNALVHSSTNYTPHSLIFGNDVDFPTVYSGPRLPNPKYIEMDLYKDILCQQLKEFHTDAKKTLDKNRSKIAETFNDQPSVNVSKYKPGDCVLIEDLAPNLKSLNPKLEPIRFGPYLIDRVTDTQALVHANKRETEAFWVPKALLSFCPENLEKFWPHPRDPHRSTLPNRRIEENITVEEHQHRYNLRPRLNFIQFSGNDDSASIDLHKSCSFELSEHDGCNHPTMKKLAAHIQHSSSDQPSTLLKAALCNAIGRAGLKQELATELCGKICEASPDKEHEVWHSIATKACLSTTMASVIQLEDVQWSIQIMMQSCKLFKQSLLESKDKLFNVNIDKKYAGIWKQALEQARAKARFLEPISSKLVFIGDNLAQRVSTCFDFGSNDVKYLRADNFSEGLAKLQKLDFTSWTRNIVIAFSTPFSKHCKSDEFLEFYKMLVTAIGNSAPNTHAYILPPPYVAEKSFESSKLLNALIEEKLVFNGLPRLPMIGRDCYGKKANTNLVSAFGAPTFDGILDIANTLWATAPSFDQKVKFNEEQAQEALNLQEATSIGYEHQQQSTYVKPFEPTVNRQSMFKSHKRIGNQGNQFGQQRGRGQHGSSQQRGRGQHNTRGQQRSHGQQAGFGRQRGDNRTKRY